MTEGDTSEVYVKGKVDESDIGKVYMAQPARIKVESFKDKTFNRQGDEDLAMASRRTTSRPSKSGFPSTTPAAS